MIEVFPAAMRSSIVAALWGRALSWNITTPRLSMPRRLFCNARRDSLSVSQ
jgi:hypothetical protein